MGDIENLAPAVSTISPLGAPPTGRLAIHQSNVTPRDFPEIATTRCGGPHQTFEPVAVRYIKLGENGKWATNALEQGTIPFGYRSVDHRACLAGNWDEVRRHKRVAIGQNGPFDPHLTLPPAGEPFLSCY